MGRNPLSTSVHLQMVQLVEPGRTIPKLSSVAGTIVLGKRAQNVYFKVHFWNPYLIPTKCNSALADIEKRVEHYYGSSGARVLDEVSADDETRACYSSTVLTTIAQR